MTLFAGASIPHPHLVGSLPLTIVPPDLRPSLAFHHLPDTVLLSISLILAPSQADAPISAFHRRPKMRMCHADCLPHALSWAPSTILLPVYESLISCFDSCDASHKDGYDLSQRSSTSLYGIADPRPLLASIRVSPVLKPPMVVRRRCLHMILVGLLLPIDPPQSLPAPFPHLGNGLAHLVQNATLLNLLSRHAPHFYLLAHMLPLLSGILRILATFPWSGVAFPSPLYP